MNQRFLTSDRRLQVFNSIIIALTLYFYILNILRLTISLYQHFLNSLISMKLSRHFREDDSCFFLDNKNVASSSTCDRSGSRWEVGEQMESPGY